MPRNGSRILRALAGADDNVTARAKAVAASNVFTSILLRFAFGMNTERPRRNAASRCSRLDFVASALDKGLNDFLALNCLVKAFEIDHFLSVIDSTNLADHADVRRLIEGTDPN
jgi:hypothetical protein